MKRKPPSPSIELGVAYRVPRSGAPIDLWLDANEGALPNPDWVSSDDLERIRRYPKRDVLSGLLAQQVGVDPNQILVTNGGDEVIDRVCRAYLGTGRNLVVSEPSFVMIGRYAKLTGAEVRKVSWWTGAYPAADVSSRVDSNTGVIAIVSPNNPTGEVVPASVIRELAERHPEALILADLAYIEFADDDPTLELLQEPNVVIIRTLSKAYGLAGLRVGYALGHPEVIACLNAAGGPYPVSSSSLQIAEQAVTHGREALGDFLSKVKEERAELEGLLDELGVPRSTSQGNFVFAEVGDGGRFRDAMSGLGIGVRAWPENALLGAWTRISCPGNEAAMARLVHGIRAAIQPAAMIFDLDGVIADVRESYRQSIILTAAHFGLEVSDEDIASIKAKGDANNDWVVTRRLLAAAGIDVSLDAVTAEFEARYQGVADDDGLWRRESLLVTKAWLEALRDAGPWKMGIVTGRPRRDAERFLSHFELSSLFDAVVCMEDAALKPDPAPVRLALKQLNVNTGWMFGDTPDDIIAARGAGVIPVGVIAPGEDSAVALVAAGAAWVQTRLDAGRWDTI